MLKSKLFSMIEFNTKFIDLKLSSTSTNIEAGEDAFNEIAMITLGLLGINLREQDLVQYATLNENKGI